MRKYLAVALAALMVAVPFAAVQAGAAEGHARADDELILRVAMQQGIKTFNPLAENDVWTGDFMYWVFDGLTWQNASNNDHIEPWASEWFHHGPNSTWSSQPWADNDNNTDFLNWTVKLREGIKWHDWKNQSGEERYVRSYDVIFSYRLVVGSPRYTPDVECLIARNPDGSVMYGKDIEANTTHGIYDGVNLTSQEDYPNLPVVLAYSESDGLTLHFRLHHPYSFFQLKTLQLPVVPERIWKNHIADRFTWNDPKCMISFGMFSFGYWNYSAEKGRLNTFRDYFHTEYDKKTGKPMPFIDAILFKVYGTTDSAVMALTSDEVDYIAWAIDPGFIDTINSHSNLALVRSSDLGFFYVAFNMRKPDFGYKDYSSKDIPAPGQEPTYNNGNYTDVGKPFRVAFAHIIDKQQIVSKFLQGFGSVGTSVVSPVNSFWYNPNIKIYDYDPAKAKTILDNAGYKDTDGNGIRELPDRGEGEIDMMVLPSDYDPICWSRPIIQHDAQAIGLNFKSVPTNFGTIVQKIENHDFDMYLLGWNIGSPISSATAPCDFFASKNDGGGQNYPGYHNQSFDKLCDEFLSSPDIYAQRNLSYRMQNAIAEDVPYSVVYYHDVIEAYNTRFTGWVPRYGTIFNRYTITQLSNNSCAPPISDIKASFSAPSVIASGNSTDITLYLYIPTSQEKVYGANVSFSALFGRIEPNNKTSDTEGSVTVRYTAPSTSKELKDVITATVTRPSCTCGQTNFTLRIDILPHASLIDVELSPSAMLTVLSNSSANYSLSVYGVDGSPLAPVNSNGTGVQLHLSVLPHANLSCSYIGNGTWGISLRAAAINGSPTIYHILIRADYSLKNAVISSQASDIRTLVVTKAYNAPPPPSENPQMQQLSPVIIGVGAVTAIALASVGIWYFFRRKKHS